jgi:hypothetical protein
MCIAASLSACDRLDPNSKPIYGKESGLPVNCRAYVQAAIDGYRAKQYTADQAMAGLERNCGIDGLSWGLR